MSYIKRILAVAAFVGLSLSAYAAVTPLNQSEYGVRFLSSVSPLAAEDCVGLPACPTGTGCTLHNAKNGRSCTTVQCCKNSTVSSTQECPSAYNYSVSDAELSEIYNLSSREYCVGYKDGIKGNYFYENPQYCEMKGLTNLPNNLNSSSSCGSYKNMIETTCGLNNGGGFESVKVCVLTTAVGYPKCKAGDVGLSAYPTNTCGAGNDEAAIPCYTECGNGKYCLNFTCAKDTLQQCSVLETQKKSEGWFSSGMSDTIQGEIYQQCLESNNIKYMGFFCQNYWEKETCENTTNNGVAGAECQVSMADGSTKKVYQCSCGTARTLEEYCAAEHPGEADCKTKYYGTGAKCTLDKDASGNTLVKYKTFSAAAKLCDDISGYKWVVKPEGGCKAYDGEPAPIEEVCRPKADGTETTQTVCKYCQNYTAETESSAKALCGTGTPVVCHWGDSKTVYMSCSCDASKYKSKEEWCTIEPYSKDENCAYNSQEGGSQCHTKPNPAGGYYSDDVATYSKITCQNQFKTKAEWCAANSSSIVSGYDCQKDYAGEGEPCKLDAEDPTKESQWKYVNYVLGCPEGAHSNIKDTIDECIVDGEATAYYEKCQSRDGEGRARFRYICKCPEGYGTTCSEAYKIRGGHVCTFDINSSGVAIKKYEKCQISCGHVYAGTHAAETYECLDIDTYVSGIRGGLEEPQMCTESNNNRQDRFICSCPSNFKTISEWCEENYAAEGLEDASVCTRSYSGRGTECRRDIEVDTAGNPVKVLSKYAAYIRQCPTDRPLYYSEEDCRFINGEFDYSCRDSSLNERVVCQCPTSWFSEDGKSEAGDTCQYAGMRITTIDSETGEEIEGVGTEYPAEAAGTTCDFEGETAVKYEQCVVKCNNVLNDPDVVIPNAYIYLPSDTGTPTNILCATRMGNGAVFGFTGIGADKSYCSLNHTLMYPCYCPATFKECSAKDNLIAADNARICSSNGKTYYSECQLMACPTETPTLAVIDPAKLSEYGEGAVSSPCTVTENGTVVEKLQVTCNASDYPDPCDYPYEAPKEGTWCKYGDGSTLMKDGRPHYKAGACRVQKTLGECGKSIVGEQSGTSYQIFTASTESECKTKYGPGISTQLCEYGAEQGYKRAYNCYYDPTDFKYTTANCGVRHDLTGNYVLINGQKHWNQCNCASAYKHHKFNCGGLLSGNPCQQELNQTLINSDATLKEAVEDRFITATETLPFYPYCQCSADYTQICDEDGSGRYKGVGEPCNGKYVSCECIPDKLPDNWTDNYYGCPGGKKPTGVWKDNGCGKKYYQCSVVECTWEYTEMCGAPLIPVGQSCQDNEGNIGGYKACTCPEEYKVCPAGQVGEGEPCNLKGVAHYKSCKSQDACTSLATETCTGPLQQGVNPCSRDGITYYESCVCANGYTEVCGEEEVGVGNFCELDGKKYYKECKKPEKSECLEKDGYVTACDTNQESYSPCAVTGEDGKQVVKYLCRCPSNWYTRSTCKNGTLGGERCLLNPGGGEPEYSYSQCNSSEECTPFQELTYSVCTAAQTGDGGSCLSTSTTTDADGNIVDGIPVTKYATCKDSNNCYETGFRYSCSGYDQSALGESCIDANGNKLYKSCPCPSSYVACSNSNASKGNKCVPLLENGSFGTPRYSSCECDRSKYKYTCKAEESGNRGIIPPAGNNYCEVAVAPTVTTTTDENGNTTTVTTENAPIRYYTSCDCASGYQYTCSDSEHGEIIPTGYESDYCLINSTKFYKGCDCSGEYIKTAQDCAAEPGQTANTSKGSCTIRGNVVEAPSYGDVLIDDTNPSGGSTGTRKANATLYKGCTCKPNYSLTCDPQKHDLIGIQGCAIDESNIKYPKCVCKTEQSKTCKASGKNLGIIPDEGAICSDMTADASGGISTIDKYTQCSCNPEYGIRASSCAYDEYVQDNEPYCDLAVNSDVIGAESDKFYKRCFCDPTIYDNSADMGDNTPQSYCENSGKTLYEEDPSIQYCFERVYDVESENIKTIKRPNKNLCCMSNVDTSYKQLSSMTFVNFSEFFEYYSEETLASTFESYCGHANNAEITLNCDGRVYYKCVNQKVANDAKSGTTWYTQSECAGLNKGREVKGTKQAITGSWKEDVDVYPDCDCNSKYQYTSDSQCSGYYAQERAKSASQQQLFCTLDDSKYTETAERKVCPDSMFKLYTGDTCTDKNNVRKYSRCVCKQGGESLEAAHDGCVSDYCGNGSPEADDFACWIRGIPEINGGKAIRISIYNHGWDQVCNCPKARIKAELYKCPAGNSASNENVTSCKYPYVYYPDDGG